MTNMKLVLFLWIKLSPNYKHVLGVNLKERQLSNVNVRSEVKRDMIFGSILYRDIQYLHMPVYHFLIVANKKKSSRILSTVLKIDLL